MFSDLAAGREKSRGLSRVQNLYPLHLLHGYIRSFLFLLILQKERSRKILFEISQRKCCNKIPQGKLKLNTERK